MFSATGERPISGGDREMQIALISPWHVYRGDLAFHTISSTPLLNLHVSNRQALEVFFTCRAKRLVERVLKIMNLIIKI
ncbi:predicted protein [Arabidopsis lyrata subsp. lyrata]|uniref:Predicted protein n=1 Tax=Arabidopsis lyrata subsp. lyrata TaxID=81972 RepID=D7KS97_ARALL|nr:predicted protein [Arabidopsis lyrata subsp. lyrata]